MPIAVILLSACVTAPPPALPAGNSYTAEAAYRKLAGAYPYIRIASSRVPDSVQAVRDLVYSRPAGRDLKLDLYLPAQRPDGPVPGIVLVHGGGWRVGSRELLAPLAIRLAERGYAAATISYRLSDEAPYPAAVHDAKAAVRWMRLNAEKHGIRPQQIAIGGGSAGGQIASLAGVTDGVARFDPEAGKGSAAVQGVIDIDGLADFNAEVARLRGDASASKMKPEDWFGGWFRSGAVGESLWRDASPVSYVSRRSPPMLFIVSSVPRFSIGREGMTERLRVNGIHSHTEELPGTPHSFWLFDPWLGATVDASVAFLDKVFGIAR